MPANKLKSGPQELDSLYGLLSPVYVGLLLSIFVRADGLSIELKAAVKTQKNS
jgi:hypothetical protein